MKSSSVIAVCLQLSAGLAFPLLRQRDENGVSVIQTAAEEGGMVGGGEGAVGGGAGEGAGEGAGGEEGGEAEEGEENEVEIEAQFDEAVALEGGDIKQDTLFPTGVNGGFEVEFQNTVGNTLTVSTNANPAAPPAGFEHLENNSFVVSLTDDSTGATLQKIDYILNADNALDISQGKVGKLDVATDTFIIDETIGELEFEVEENELTLSVVDLNGEWAVFVPVAEAGAGDGAGEGAGEGADGGAGGEAGGDAPTTGNSILDSVLKLIGEGAAAADAAGEAINSTI